MSDRAQIAALGERFDRERPRLAFDGCMRQGFGRVPSGSMTLEQAKTFAEIVGLSCALMASTHVRPWTAVYAEVSMRHCLTMIQLVRKFRGDK